MKWSMHRAQQHDLWPCLTMRGARILQSMAILRETYSWTLRWELRWDWVAIFATTAYWITFVGVCSKVAMDFRGTTWTRASWILELKRGAEHRYPFRNHFITVIWYHQILLSKRWHDLPIFQWLFSKPMVSSWFQEL